MDVRVVLFAFCSVFVAVGISQSDDTVMQALRTSLGSPSYWNDSAVPCKWEHVRCNTDGSVTAIQIGNRGLTGALPSSLNKLKYLQTFEVQNNNLSGPLPSFSGLTALSSILLNNNNFTSIPQDFFNGLSSLQAVYLDDNRFSQWSIPDDIKYAWQLVNFSASSANIIGPLPINFGNFSSSLKNVNLAFNYLEGPLPSSFAGSQIQKLWLNDQKSTSKLNGSIAVLQNMTQLTQVWVHRNNFYGPLPDFSGLYQLGDLNLRDNKLTGPVPDTLVNLPSLSIVNLTGNSFQGKFPNFSSSVKSDLVPNTSIMSFCLQTPGLDCDPRVTILLDVSQAFGYPFAFADSWKGNDPCSGWQRISCNNKGNITVVNFKGMGLTGYIPPSFSKLMSLVTLDLSNNNLSGSIPGDLTTMASLTLLDVSNNQLSGKIPVFNSTVVLKTDGNVNIGKDIPPPPGVPGSSSANGKKNHTGLIVGIVVGVVLLCLIVGMVVLCRKNIKPAGKSYSPYNKVIHPRTGSEDQLVISVANSTAYEETKGTHQGKSGPSDLHIVDTGNMVISIDVLRNVTNNFSGSNILGSGGFGTVYEGVLHDGTKIAVKRMESNVATDKGLEEFKSEISVLTKVRHRHLVALLGHCLEGNERLLVYEHMPQGTLSRFLFGWKSEGLKPLEWAKRLTIALDVARGVEYLHSLARQSFIHRDLKPSNILLGDDMRAKVADFGLVRLAPDGQASVATKLAGTFGYLAPEYAVTGKVTTKIDVYSFGVILMELITGRKALDESLEDDAQHLVPWFRRMLIKKDTFVKAIDPWINAPDEKTLASIITVAELAGHCTARDPAQRPDMGHAVNVISSLVEQWRPSEPADADDLYGIDHNTSLSQAIMKWQSLEGMTGVEGPSQIGDYSDSSSSYTIPIRPSGFASGFASTEGR